MNTGEVTLDTISLTYLFSAIASRRTPGYQLRIRRKIKNVMQIEFLVPFLNWRFWFRVISHAVRKWFKNAPFPDISKTTWNGTQFSQSSFWPQGGSQIR